MYGVRVSIYIVTYKNPVDLNNNISSILASGFDITINVINNHSHFFLAPEYENSVTVLHNVLRPDFSTGHLARNWNQALLHGFRDLNSPANDIVITVQDDVLFNADWLHHLIRLHRQYSFITMGLGDAFCSYLPEAVKKVGLWDERFCNIGYQEADYFFRSLIYNREGCSINDIGHGRLHNAVEGNSLSSIGRAESLLVTLPHRNSDRRESLVPSIKSWALSETFFKHKWGVSAVPWPGENVSISKSIITNYIMYPYFEKDIEGLREKNYLMPEEDAERRFSELALRVAAGSDVIVKPSL